MNAHTSSKVQFSRQSVVFFGALKNWHLFGCSKLPCILERPYSILMTLSLLKYLPYYNPGLLPLADGAVCQVARQRLFGRFPPGGGFVQPGLVPSVAGGARAGWLDVSIIYEI